LERFTRQNDKAALEKILYRHGPMVLGVCRRVLGHVQDAEDAFQATFLVLIQKAPAIRKPESLGNWLYGVAFRIARRAKNQALRRHHLERELKPGPAPNPLHDAAWHEFRSLLVGELECLPPLYRAPLALCYLEGLTNEEAARRLGWPTGSISYRLARGRQLLRARLTDRHAAFAWSGSDTSFHAPGPSAELPSRAKPPSSQS
jgi:RNA polymerase sigma factor (sigma-70 family)